MTSRTPVCLAWVLPLALLGGIDMSQRKYREHAG